MQARVLIGIFSVLTCILLFILVKGYIEAMNVYSLPKVNPYELAQFDNNGTKPLAMPDWLDRLSGQDEREFIYPASELQVKLLFANKLKQTSKEIYRVSVGIISDYQFFCINQVLGAYNIEYSYYKIGENISLVVATEDESYLRNVLEKLKHYEIHYTLSKS